MKLALSPLQRGIVSFLQSNETWLRPLLTERIFDGVDVQAEGDKLANPDVVYPDYYKQDFHSVEGGYLNKDAAITYDPITKQILVPNEDFLRQETANAIPAEAKRILDLGCGTGTATRAIASRLPQAQVVGVDLSPYMVFAARLKAQSIPNASFIHANAEELPFEDESFDAVTASLLFHETPLDAALRIMTEARRVLKPNGKFVVFDGAQGDGLAKLGGNISSALFLEPYAEQFLSSNLLNLMREAGFAKVETRSLLLIYEIRTGTK
ncbi:MAG: methyltransferase domain-containing protein [Chloroherpetonaceae bacterium]|nr:methyltransferase domain-containing protein [Chloroherpetonaceae bacterium]MDW8438687.1 methyltransferase domain-containing protein [Chloroherpetonaceae bacterium]